MPNLLLADAIGRWRQALQPLHEHGPHEGGEFCTGAHLTDQWVSAGDQAATAWERVVDRLTPAI